MGKSELFSYLSAFVTIVLAIAMTDMIQSTHRLIRARRRIRWDARPLVFAAAVALAVVSEFFSIWYNLALNEISMSRLLWLLATPTTFALLAYSALPDECPETGIDLTQFYDDERRILASLFLAAAMLDIMRTVEKYISQDWPLLPFFAFAGPFLAASFVGLLLIYFARGRIWSWVGLILLSASVLSGMTGWVIKAETGV